MTWQKILDRCRAIKEDFDRSYKCLNIDRQIGQNTIDKHIKIILQCLEEIRTILNVNYERLTSSHKIAAEAFFHDTRDKVIQIATKKNIDIKIPETIQERINIETVIQTKKIETETPNTVNSCNMAEENLNATELASVSKLISIFTGTKEELNPFIANLEIIIDTIPEHKRTSFFNFVYKTKLTTKVQNRLRQNQIPTNIDTLISNLKETYKIKKSPNIVINELSRAIQTDSIRKFADKIESLTLELNEIQISTLGEEHRDIISKTNAALAFNSFKNGLKNKDITRTIEASRVKKLSEAIEIAMETATDIRQNQILFQTSQTGSNFRNNWNNSNNYNRNNRNQNNHFIRNNNDNGNRTNRYNNNNNFHKNNNNRNNYNNRMRNNNRSSNRSYNDSNYNNSNRNNNNNHRNFNNNNRTINHMNNQGNSQSPEVLDLQRSPEQDQ